MVQVLAQKFDQLQDSYLRIRDHLMPLDEEYLNHSPSPGKWSPLQIFCHLQQSEFLSVRYLKKKIPEGSYPATGLRESFLSKILGWALASPLKFKAPAAVSENIPDILNKNDLFRNFEENREEMKTLLQNFPAARMNEAIYKHPRIGYINMSQALDFLLAHFTHHEKQIRNLTKP